MGIRGLSSFLKNTINEGNGYSIENNLENYRGKIIAIDCNQMIFKYLLMNNNNQDIMLNKFYLFKNNNLYHYMINNYFHFNHHLKKFHKILRYKIIIFYLYKL